MENDSFKDVFDRIDSRFSSISHHLDGIDASLDRIDLRLQSLPTYRQTVLIFSIFAIGVVLVAFFSVTLL